MTDTTEFAEREVAAAREFAARAAVGDLLNAALLPRGGQEASEALAFIDYHLDALIAAARNAGRVEAQGEVERLRAEVVRWQDHTRIMVLGHKAGILDDSVGLAMAIEDMRNAGMQPFTPEPILVCAECGHEAGQHTWNIHEGMQQTRQPYCYACLDYHAFVLRCPKCDGGYQYGGEDFPDIAYRCPACNGTGRQEVVDG